MINKIKQYQEYFDYLDGLVKAKGTPYIIPFNGVIIFRLMKKFGLDERKATYIAHEWAEIFGNKRGR